MSTETDPRYHEIKYEKFMSIFAKVSTQAGYLDMDDLGKQLNHVSKLEGLGDCSTEFQMYLTLCEDFNAALGAAKLDAPKGQAYVFKDTSNHFETATEDMKPDLSMYPDTDAASRAFCHGIDYTKTSMSKARTAWGWMTTAVEVKHDVRKSAFYFGEDEQGLLRDTPDGRYAQVQFSEYAAQILCRQHRVSTFLIYVCGTKARLTRWDRTGCVVSSPIDLEKEPMKLLYFVYLLGLMSPAELGYDDTAVLATDEEIRSLRAMPHVNEYAKECAEEILKPETTMFHPIYKITRDNTDGTGSRTYFVGKHSVATYSITGRATKGYITFIVDKSRLGFLKDYWRPLSSRITSELDIYEELRAKEVRYVATVFAGGDVEGQVTRTDEFLPADGPYAPLKRAHCCIVFNELARPLEDYKHSGVLIAIVFHALIAHQDAWEKAGILHRDISCGNIMFVVDQDNTTSPIRGILNDWDLCKHKHDLELESTQKGRSGTWAFMSGVSLKYPLKPYQLYDDLEAFIHVLTFSCLRFQWHSLTPLPLNNFRGSSKVPTDAQLVLFNSQNSILGEHVALYYDKCYRLPGDSIDRGGQQKVDFALSCKLGWNFTFASKPLQLLVTRLCQLLQSHYKQLDLEAMEPYSAINVSDTNTAPFPTESDRPSYDIEALDPSGLLDADIQGRDAEVAEAPNRRPQNGPGKTLNTHSAIVSIFASALSQVYHTSNFPMDKAPDQFRELREYYANTPRGPSCTPRTTTASQPLASAATPDQGAELIPLQADRKRKSNTNLASGVRRSTKKSRTDEQRSIEKQVQPEVVASGAGDDVDEPESEEET